MCGFIGSISFYQNNLESLLSANKIQTCRGPDELTTLSKKISQFDEKVKNDKYINLVFNRLAIQDLSNNGSQPMYSKDFNSLIMLNGEIFNHNELRDELRANGVSLVSESSDTEVALKQLSFFGKSAVQKFNGQFSIVFFDFKNNSLMLIRDRLGQKPLFYFNNTETLIFSSNLKSLISNLGDYKIDEHSIQQYLELGVVPAPNTIFKNVYKVKPGEIIETNLNQKKIILETQQFWIIDNFVAERKFDESSFEEKLSEAIKIRHRADVPIANLLSGGIDSTSIIKIMSQNNFEINSFTATYREKKYDESYWSNIVVERFKLSHQQKQISTKSVDTEIFNTLDIFDEPYFDPSNLPSNLIYSEISKKFKVAISGDGGDELLNGYIRTNLAIKRSNKPYTFDALAKIYPKTLGTGSNLSSYSNQLDTSYFSFLSDTNFKEIFFKKTHNNSYLKNLYRDTGDKLKNLILIDYKFFLSEQMLLKVDRTSMANSLEVRSPFMDHKLIEYMLGVNYDDPKVGKKQYLKNLLKEDFDDDFINRKKMGFVFNLEKWVYENEVGLKRIIQSNQLPFSIEQNVINILFTFKTRINSHRIWKLITLIRYFQHVDNIIKSRNQ